MCWARNIINGVRGNEPMEGWIKLYRSLTQHGIWTEKPFSRGQAWVDLLLIVNHKPAKVLFGGKIVTVGIGSRVTSIRALSDRWGWSRTKTVAFFDLLENEKMLSRKSDKKKTLLTIANYKVYQESNDAEKPIKGHKKATEKPLKSLNKNDKNDKNINNKFIYAQFDDFWAAYPRKVAKQDARKAWDALKPDASLFTLILGGLERARQTAEWTKDSGQYIPYPATWIRGRRWEDECSGDTYEGVET